MAKSETISTAAKPEDLEKAYNSASKALSTLGIKMTTKKPDPAKLGPAMAKNKKKAEFKLIGDTKTLKLTVECDGTVNTLGLLDVGAEKDAAKRLVILKSLFEAGLISKSDVQAAEKEMDTGPDPKVVANLEREITATQKQIDDNKRIAASYAGLMSYDAVAKFPTVLKELEAWTKSHFTDENINFLKAVGAKMDRTKLVNQFIKAGSKEELNIDAGLRGDIESGAKEPSAAVSVIKGMITDNDLFLMKKAKATELGAIVATAEKRLATLMETKKKLGLK